jgi:hypothetical protein
MTKVDLEAGLKSLRRSLRQVKDLLAWEQLKLAEAKPGQPPSFSLTDPTETELKNEYSFFLYTLVQMHSILNDCNTKVAKATRQRVKSELLKIQRQIYALDLQLQRRFC